MAKSLSDKARSFLDRAVPSVGFETYAITEAGLPDIISERLNVFVQKKRHGTMAWMEETKARRAHPQSLWPEARSAIILGLNYGPDHNPLAVLERKNHAAISVYAQNRDYHDIIKGRLKTLAGQWVSRFGGDVKVFVDTAPLMEKPLAAQAGLGWQGKHTNLVSRSFGSWLFLGVILTTLELESDTQGQDHCGACRACLDICPTDAFPAPYQIDARRCISYLTIEHKGPIDRALRPLMGNRIYGCDDCLAVCPWNKFAKDAHEMKLKARDTLKAPELADLIALDDQAFRNMFSGSPIKRIGRNRFIRNVLMAIGNSSNRAFVPQIIPCLTDNAAIVRGSAVWALWQLDADIAEHHAMALESNEQDQDVRDEWHYGRMNRKMEQKKPT